LRSEFKILNHLDSISFTEISYLDIEQFQSSTNNKMTELKHGLIKIRLLETDKD